MCNNQVSKYNYSCWSTCYYQPTPTHSPGPTVSLHLDFLFFVFFLRSLAIASLQWKSSPHSCVSAVVAVDRRSYNRSHLSPQSTRVLCACRDAGLQFRGCAVYLFGNWSIRRPMYMYVTTAPCRRDSAARQLDADPPITTCACAFRFKTDLQSTHMVEVRRLYHSVVGLSVGQSGTPPCTLSLECPSDQDIGVCVDCTEHGGRCV